MKILQSVSFYPPVTGGVESQVSTLVRYLRDSGNTPVVITSDYPRGIPSDCEVIRLRSCVISASWGRIAISPEIYRILKEVKPDIIHAHTPARFFAESTVLTRRFLGIRPPIVLSYHLHNESLPSIENLVLNIYNRTIMRKVFGNVDRIIVPNKLYKNLLQSIFEISSEKILAVPYGVDCNFFDPTRYNVHEERENFQIHQQNVVLYVGRLTTQKGLEYLLQAFRLVVQQFQDSLLVIVGEGKLRGHLQDFSKKLGINEKTVFTGGLPSNDIPAIMSLATVLVLPSISESFGIVLVEAMAMEKPVVSTDVGGTSEIVESEKNGILVQKGDVEGLASAIESLLADKNKAHNMGLLGRSRVKKDYSLEKFLKETTRIYDEVLSDSLRK